MVATERSPLAFCPALPPAVVSSSMLGVDITLWSANTDNMGVGPYRLLLQDDGNVSVYDSRSVRTWHAGTAGL